MNNKKKVGRPKSAETLTENKPLRYPKKVYEYLEMQSQQTGLSIGELTRQVLLKWFENEERAKTKTLNANLIDELQILVQTLNSLNISNQSVQETKVIKIESFLPSKKFTFAKFLDLSEEQRMEVGHFCLDWNLKNEFGDLGKTKFMEIKGEALSKFEEQFGVIEEEIEELPF